MSSRREKRSEHAETVRILWSSCRNCGMKNWKPAMQLKVKKNGKKLAAVSGRLLTITLKNTHAHTLPLCDLSSDPVANCI